MADKKLYFRIGDDGEYKLAVINGKNKGTFNGVAWDNTPAPPPPTYYTITPTLINVTADSGNPTTIQRNGTATLHFTADTGYELPDSIPDEYVSGVRSFSWDKATGTLTLSGAIGNVTFIIGGVASKFSDDSWATIAQNIKAGTDHYRLGDTKTDSVTISGTPYAGIYSVTFKIVDNKVGRYETQSGQSHKVIEIQQIFGNNSSGGVVWNSSGSATSFNASSIKNTLNNTIINFLPSELRAVLETTTVYSGDGTQTASASTNVGATCKLFLASFNEYYGADASLGWANNSETEGQGQYTWYQQAGVTTSNYEDMIKHKIESASAIYAYWTRSPASNLGTVFVNGDGSSDYDDVSNSDNRIAPCFAW